jgi:energy-coupling factor transporter ATP-binding protein EcfA2
MKPFVKNLRKLLDKDAFYLKIRELFSLQTNYDHDSLEEELEARIDSLYIEYHQHYVLYRNIFKLLVYNYQSYDMNKVSADLTSYRYDHDLNIKRKGLFIVGGSGSGKTTLIKSIRYLFGRKIFLPKLNITYIPILIIDCPHKMSTRNLCLNILSKLDEELNTAYRTTHNSKTEGDLINKIHNLLAVHKVGLIVFDEIHNILEVSRNKLSSKNKQAHNALKFFKNLANETQIPIVYVGIPGAEEVLNLSFQSYRRMSGNGTLRFPNLSMFSNDVLDVDCYEYFLERLWTIQVPGQEQTLTEEIKIAYYLGSLGSPDLLKTIHKFNLFNLIKNEKEKFVIDSNYIKQVLRFNLIDYKKIANDFYDLENKTFIEFNFEEYKSKSTSEPENIGLASVIKKPEIQTKFKQGEKKGFLSSLVKATSSTVNRYNLLKSKGYIFSLSDIE